MPNDLATIAAFGELLGARAWPGFLVLLGAVAVVAGVAAWTFEHMRHRQVASGEPQPRRLFAGLALGLALVLLLAWGFAEVAEELGQGRPMGVFDDAMSRAVGAHTPAGVRAVFAQLTHLADPWFGASLSVAVALLLWLRGHRGFATGWAAATGGIAVLNHVLKDIFERARPVHEAGFVQVSGYSFPSGHSSGSMVMYGMLGYLGFRMLAPGWRVPTVVAASVIVVTVACSRIFLRAHFPSDVIAGLCSGGAWLAVCIASIEFARHRRGSRQAPP